MNNIPWPVAIFFGVLYAIGLFGIFKPDNLVNLTVKYFKWLMKLYGFEGEIKSTSKAKIICRRWNIFMLVVLTCFMFLIFSGKLKQG